MRNPDLRTSFRLNDETYDVAWYDASADEPLPEVAWYQVYAVGNLENKVPIVHYPNARDNLPGGKLEPGENIEAALRREIREELNMSVLHWYPIGYQIVSHPNGKVTNELRVYADLEKIGEFVNDPGGHITGHSLVSIGELNKFIQYGPVGERLITLVHRQFERPGMDHGYPLQ